MVDFPDSFANVSTDLLEKQMDCNTPGFYDHPNFLEIETRFPEFLNNYARFVQKREYDKDYLARARNETPVIAMAFLLDVQQICMQSWYGPDEVIG